MALHKQSELMVYRLVQSGELEIDSEGRIWRLMKRTYDRWTGGTRVVRCKRVRAENALGKSNDYLQVRAMIDGKRHHAMAARLVWLHFKGPIPQGITVNHEDGMKPNNRPSNLELATYSEQRHHAIKQLGARHADVRGSRNPKAQTTEAAVMTMRQKRAAGARVKDIAASVGMRPGAVSAIVCGTNWKHVPLPQPG
ncbi:MAG TPA: HNH endonuclease signature motif containing protein [Gammaproteobacteria bacterium]|nr:HNH endonuclease signature motif containing protein [Gammaproteobacteria bacterium]